MQKFMGNKTNSLSCPADCSESPPSISTVSQDQPTSSSSQNDNSIQHYPIIDTNEEGSNDMTALNTSLLNNMVFESVETDNEILKTPNTKSFAEFSKEFYAEIDKKFPASHKNSGYKELKDRFRDTIVIVESK